MRTAVIASVIAGSVSALKKPFSSDDAAWGTIKGHLNDMQDFKVDVDATPKCVMSATESCPIGDMPPDATTLVYPGGETRCIYSTSTDFAFQVIPGDSDKLLFFFQGGGACWDPISTAGGFCTSDASPNSLSGMFERDNGAANTFADYTIVQVLYCSGDLHAGNVTRDYTDSRGVPIEQRGYYNTKAAVDWAKANTDATLASFWLSGASAGSLGVQAWAADLLDAFAYDEGAVVVDSYAGVFPVGTQGPLIYGYGMCGLPLLEGDLLAACAAQTLEIQDVFEDAIASFPEVGFSHVNSKADAVQISFFSAIAVTENVPPFDIPPAQYENAVNLIFERYNAQPNYVSYLVTSSQHTYFQLPIYYTTDTTGTKGKGAGGQPLLQGWAEQFPVLAATTVGTQCDGPLLAQDEWTGSEYCDVAQAGKTYTA